MVDVLVHPFEAAGLGLAPFRLERVETSGLAGCAVCGTPIKIHCWIRSSDGRTFMVGSDCVRKTTARVDRSLSLDVRRALSDIRRQKNEAARVARWEKLSARRSEALATLAAAPDLFADLPHPFDYFAKQGKTKRDYVLYLLDAGERSRIDACQMVEAATLSSPPLPRSAQE